MSHSHSHSHQSTGMRQRENMISDGTGESDVFGARARGCFRGGRFNVEDALLLQAAVPEWSAQRYVQRVAMAAFLCETKHAIVSLCATPSDTAPARQAPHVQVLAEPTPPRARCRRSTHASVLTCHILSRPSVCRSVCLSLYPAGQPAGYLAVHGSTNLSVYAFAAPPYLSTYQPTFLPIPQSIHPSVPLSLYPSIPLSLYLPFCLSVHLPISLPGRPRVRPPVTAK